MFVKDLKYIIPGNCPCEVYKCENGVLNKKNIFHDYVEGIKFEELERYGFVWEAKIDRMGPRDNRMVIIICNVY